MERIVIRNINGLIILLFIALAGSAIAAECLKYEPSNATLCGTIIETTYPGPPNYESVKDGDRPEIYWVLHLDVPICTRGEADNELNASEENIKEVQLVLKEKQYNLYKDLVGTKVCVFGSLFHAISGHHHTIVLLTVKEIKKAA
jgi:hypothetical protein